MSNTTGMPWLKIADSVVEGVAKYMYSEPTNAQLINNLLGRFHPFYGSRRPLGRVEV
jgi:hypothetical protein